MFIDTLRATRVSYSNYYSDKMIILFGLILWGIPACLYITALVLESESIPRAFWITDISAHVAVGILVYCEAYYTEGKYWPLQTAIIGMATFIIFTLAGLIGFYLSQDDSTLVGITAAALATACIANAVMVSILFEYFHRGVYYTDTNPVKYNFVRTKTIMHPVIPRSRSFN